MTLIERIKKLEAEVVTLKNLDPAMIEGLDLLRQMKGNYGSAEISYDTRLNTSGEIECRWSAWDGQKHRYADTLPELVAAIRAASPEVNGKAEAEVAAQLASEDAERLRMEEAALQIGPADSDGNITVEAVS